MLYISDNENPNSIPAIETSAPAMASNSAIPFSASVKLASPPEGGNPGAEPLAADWLSVPLYRESACYAREHGELDVFRASKKANLACKTAIETAIRENHRENQFDAETAARQVLDQFGYARVAYILSCTIRNKDWDKRFCLLNKEWVKTIPVVRDIDGFGNNRNDANVVNSHSVLLDAFATIVRKQPRELWMRLGVMLRLTAEEADTIMRADTKDGYPAAQRTVQKIIQEGRFIPNGDSYVPDIASETYNDAYGTNYLSIDNVSFEL